MDSDDPLGVTRAILGSVMKAATSAVMEMIASKTKYQSKDLGVLAAKLCMVRCSLDLLQPKQPDAVSQQLENFLRRLEDIFAVGRTILASSIALANFGYVAIWCYHE